MPFAGLALSCEDIPELLELSESEEVLLKISYVNGSSEVCSCWTLLPYNRDCMGNISKYFSHCGWPTIASRRRQNWSVGEGESHDLER